MMKALRIPLLWLGLVLFLGGSWFGAPATGPWIVPALKWLVPWASPRELSALHLVVRKLAHLTEYAILARLWLHGVLVWRGTTVRRAAWAALLISAVCAFVDEAHQSMLPTRTGNVGDAILDCLGALMMLIMLRARYEDRPARAVGAATPEPGG